MLNFLIIAVLFFAGSFADETSLRVSLMLMPSEIRKSQDISALIEIKNTGTTDIEIPRPHSEEFNALLVIDNANWKLA